MLTTEGGRQIHLGNLIAKGGEGEVFEIINESRNCIKIYHSNISIEDKEEKLKYMCINQPSDLEAENFRICWPKEVIYDNDRFVGYLMPKAFDDSLLPYHLCQPNIPEKLSSKWKNTYDRNNSKGIVSRLKLSTNIIAVVSRVVSSGDYVIVDLKPQNILVTSGGNVSLIDMDSVQIVKEGKVLFKAPVSTPEYTPPEAKEILKSEIPITSDWDTFSLGVIVYEIMCGIHPYVGTANPPNDNLSTISEKIDNNITHITSGKEAFSTLPPPHNIFELFSTKFKILFENIFREYTLGISSRPKLEVFGGIIFEEVELFIHHTKEVEVSKSIQENEKLKLELFQTKRELASIKQELNSFKESYGLLDIDEKVENKPKEKEELKSSEGSDSSGLTIVLIGLLIAIVLIILNK